MGVGQGSSINVDIAESLRLEGREVKEIEDKDKRAWQGTQRLSSLKVLVELYTQKLDCKLGHFSGILQLSLTAIVSAVIPFLAVGCPIKKTSHSEMKEVRPFVAG